MIRVFLKRIKLFFFVGEEELVYVYRAFLVSEVIIIKSIDKEKW